MKKELKARRSHRICRTRRIHTYANLRTNKRHLNECQTNQESKFKKINPEKETYEAHYEPLTGTHMVLAKACSTRYVQAVLQQQMKDHRTHNRRHANERDYKKVEWVDDEGMESVEVSVLDCVAKDYMVITLRCKDRPKLLIDIVCTITDMQYVVYDGLVHTGQMEAYQLAILWMGITSVLMKRQDMNQILEMLWEYDLGRWDRKCGTFIAALFVIGWNLVSTTIILLVIKIFLPLRMPDHELMIGDDAVLGEEAYALWGDGEKYDPTRHGAIFGAPELEPNDRGNGAARGVIINL
ncbi:ammonium transporter 2 [Artemisia annua]|uniref:ACT domain-containing protein ACR n=1 Tax=Artemisia annua TaxID=35608 RepID=A0A2U1M077_ARTAN|nr:ammonium transporter 2 [Artemisia annua]